MLLCSAFSGWPSLRGQIQPLCRSEAVANANWNGNKAADDFDTSFDCRISRRRSQRSLYLQTAEDEVRVTAAAKGDNKAPRKKASRETRHQVWRYYIILVPNGLTLSPRPSARRKNGADLAGDSMPSDDMPVAKTESLALLNARLVNFVEHEDDGDVLVADKDFQDLLKNHQIACHEPW